MSHVMVLFGYLSSADAACPATIPRTANKEKTAIKLRNTGNLLVNSGCRSTD